jgi:hypothetical protein
MATVISSISRQGAYEPFELQVSRGQIQGHTRTCPFGFNTAVGTTEETIWSVGGVYSFPSTATVLTVVSDDADDDGSPVGNGARTVVIEGLDANYLPITETVTMNGTTAVTTTQSFLRVNTAYVATAGSSNSNEGTITIANSTPTTLAAIAATAGVAEQCVYTVPAGYTAYITRYMVSSYNATANAGSTGKIYVRPFGGAFLLVTVTRIQAIGAFTCEADYPFQVTGKSDIDFRGIAFLGSSNMSAQLQMVVIKEGP